MGEFCMTHLERLESVIEDLDKSSRNFETILIIVDEVKKATEQVNGNTELLQNVSAELSEVLKATETSQKSIVEAQELLIQEVRKIKTIQEEFQSEMTLQVVQNHNQQFEMNQHLKNSIQSNIEQSKNQIESELRSLNHEFRREVLDSIISQRMEVRAANDEIIKQNKKSYKFLQITNILVIVLLVLIIVILIIMFNGLHLF